MRKSLGLVVGLVSLLSAACGGAVDGGGDDGAPVKSASAFGVPPNPTASPVLYSNRVVLEPRPKFPPTLIPPAPAPVLATVSGWAGFTGEHGHTDGSFVTRFDKPTLVAALPNGMTWVLDQDLTDSQNFDAIRLITPTRGTTASHVQTVAVQSSVTAIALGVIGGMAADPATSDLYVTDSMFNRIVKLRVGGSFEVVVNGAPQPAFADGNASTARFTSPTGIAMGANGVLYVADTNNHAIRKVTTAGDVTTMAIAPGSTFSPKSIAIDSRNGTVYATSGNAVYSVSPAGLIAIAAGDPNTAGLQNGIAGWALFDDPKGLAVDRDGNVYVADSNNHALRKIVAPVGVSVAMVETVPSLAPFDPKRTTLDGYGYDEAGLEQPWGLAFMGDRLVFSDATRPTVRIAN